MDFINTTERMYFLSYDEKLGMTKLSSRWVPRLLIVEQKWNRMITSAHCLDMFKRNPKEFIRRFVTVDETWIHHYTPEMTKQSKQWTSPCERAPKKAKTVPLVFWDWRGEGQSQDSFMLIYWADLRLN